MWPPNTHTHTNTGCTGQWTALFTVLSHTLGGINAHHYQNTAVTGMATLVDAFSLYILQSALRTASDFLRHPTNQPSFWILCVCVCVRAHWKKVWVLPRLTVPRSWLDSPIRRLALVGREKPDRKVDDVVAVFPCDVKASQTAWEHHLSAGPSHSLALLVSLSLSLSLCLFFYSFFRANTTKN